MALSNKQQAFINAYLQSWNATDAAKHAGYSKKSARVIGHENLTKPDIAAEIRARVADQTLTANEVLARLAAQARGDMADFLRFNDNGDPVFDFQAAAEMDKLGLVKKIKIEASRRQRGSEGVTETTIEFELYSSQAALVHIGKHHGLFDKRGSEDDPVHNVDWTVEQWREEVEERRNQAAGTIAIFDETESDAEQDFVY